MKKKIARYRQIYLELKQEIFSGKYASGTFLPPVDFLAKEYKVSSITINSALDLLKEEGFIRRIKSKGSCVTALPDSKEMQDSPSPEGLPLIGIILEHISSCFGLDLLYAADQFAQKKGYRLITRFSYGNRERENEEIVFLRNLGVCGIICMPVHGKYFNTGMLRLAADHFPAVLIDKQLKGIPIPSVGTDNKAATAALVRYLVSHKKRHIGLITVDDPYTSSVSDRNRGFQEAIARRKLPVMPILTVRKKVESSIFSYQADEECEKAIEDYLHRHPNLDAVIITEYGLARYLKAPREEWARLNLTICCVAEDYLSPGGTRFTHIRQNEPVIARAAIRLLIEQIEKRDDHAPESCLIPGILQEATLSALPPMLNTRMQCFTF